MSGSASAGREPDAPRDENPDTLESFVALLHDEGVEAGRQEAARIVREAEAEAKVILEQARREADGVRSGARAAAEREMERARAELRLATRDAVLALQASLRSTLQSLLSRATTPPLRDPAFLRTLLKEMLGAYAQSDADGGPPVAVRAPESVVADLESWALAELGRELAVDGPAADTVRAAGFEYTVAEGTVEVSVEAVTDALAELLGPRLRAVLDEAAVASPSSEPAAVSRAG